MHELDALDRLADRCAESWRDDAAPLRSLRSRFERLVVSSRRQSKHVLASACADACARYSQKRFPRRAAIEALTARWRETRRAARACPTVFRRTSLQRRPVDDIVFAAGREHDDHEGRALRRQLLAEERARRAYSSGAPVVVRKMPVALAHWGRAVEKGGVVALKLQGSDVVEDRAKLAALLSAAPHVVAVNAGEAAGHEKEVAAALGNAAENSALRRYFVEMKTKEREQVGVPESFARARSADRADPERPEARWLRLTEQEWTVIDAALCPMGKPATRETAAKYLAKASSATKTEMGAPADEP